MAVIFLLVVLAVAFAMTILSVLTEFFNAFCDKDEDKGDEDEL